MALVPILYACIVMFGESFIDQLTHIGAGKEVTPSKGKIWPLPQKYASGSTFFTIDPHAFNFLYNNKCDIIVEATKRYQKLSFLDCSKAFNYPHLEKQFPNSNGQLYNLKIIIAGPCEKYPYMDMDEKYLLVINAPDTAFLYSNTVWGTLRGLETFSQLVYQLRPGLFAVNSSIVLDFPRFSYRGLLLDTSRHFIPVPVLLKNLDAMAYSKLNVFHWHIVDDQSFPYVSKKFPDLSRKGAFNPDTHVYSQEDIANIIEYARLRGIRVIPEFDTPGHTLSWGKGQPNLLTQCYDGLQPNGKYGPIDPTVSSTYTFLKSLFGEINEVFPDGYVHLGGDEISFSSWASNPQIQKFMKEQGFLENYSKLQGYYIQKLVDIINSFNKSCIVWQEVFDAGTKINSDTVIQVWKFNYKKELATVTSAGYKAILSSCWYLNYINYGSDWINYYKCDPYNFIGTDSQKRLVIGGEVSNWGEFVDGSNVITRTWPRAAVVAERLWSDQDINDISKASPRLEEMRCRMIKRGLMVEPINGPGYCECDYLVNVQSSFNSLNCFL